jgi:hypothetical protein
MNVGVRLCSAIVLAGLGACSGGLNQNEPSLQLDAADPVSVAAGTETGPPSKIVPVPGSAAVDALFPDGLVFYSPNGFNLGGGGATIRASGGVEVTDIEAVPGGVDTLLANGTVYFSPDGKNLNGGGNSVLAYGGSMLALSINPVAGGLDTVFSGGQVYFSPDGRDLGGGGQSIPVYTGGRGIQQVVATGSGDAVVTLFQGGAAYYSPINRDLGGGGSTVPATANANTAITRLVKVGGGILAQFATGSVYLSPDGLNLGASGSVPVSAWNASTPNGPFGGRDSAHGAIFAGRFWFSGGFDDPENANSCYATCSYFDLWSSTDPTGTTWNGAPSFATATSPDPRDTLPVVNDGVQDVAVPTDFYDSYSAIVPWNGKLFAIGSTVWSSANGTTWARANLSDGSAVPGPQAGSRATENSRAFQLGNTLFFLQPDSGEVYSTTDPQARTWTNLGLIPGFTPRCGPVAFVLLGKLWIEGGGACDYSAVYDDIWSSADGITWTQSSTSTQWFARMWGCIASGSEGIIWLTGGYAPTDWNDSAGTLTPRYGANHSDVWYTKDGVTWKQLKADWGSGLPDGNTLEPRHAATCYEDESTNPATLTVIAGSAGTSPDAGNEHVSNTIRLLQLPPAATLP